MKLRRWGVLSGVLLAVIVSWFVLNRPHRFGVCCFYGLLTYDMIPGFFKDLEVREDGQARFVPKAELINEGALTWLLEGGPEVIVVGKGWRGHADVHVTLPHDSGTKIQVLTNRDAIELYRLYKKAGRRVGVYLHSTN